MAAPKRNAWHTIKEERDKLQARVAELESLPTRKLFVANLLESIGIILANTPYKEWPNVAKVAFEHQQQLAPTSAHDYRNRLPKE